VLLLIEAKLAGHVAKEHVRLGVLLVEGGDIQIDPAIAVHVAPSRSMPHDAGDMRKQAGFIADVAEDKSGYGLLVAG
jgi:hypothetical protein